MIRMFLLGFLTGAVAAVAFVLPVAAVSWLVDGRSR